MEIVHRLQIANKQTMRRRRRSVAFKSSDLYQIYIVSTMSLTQTCSPAWQAKRCYVINVCARDAISSLLAAASDAARICFDIRIPHTIPVHYTGARGHCGTTAAFDVGMIGGRDQIHATHGRTHA